jgi:predicted CopG family antitoxin
MARLPKKRQITVRLSYEDYRELKGWARADKTSCAPIITELIERERRRRAELEQKEAA